MRVVCALGVPVLVAIALVIACNPASSNGQACGELTSQAEVAIGLAQAQAGEDLSCTTAADCIVVASNTACLPSCGAVMNHAGAAKLEASIAQINSGVCALFASDGCPANPAPSCPTLVPKCVAGACEALTSSEDAGSDDAGVSSTEDAGSDAADADGSSASNDSSAPASGDAGLDATEGAPPPDGAAIDAPSDASDAEAGE